jgi:hypothetical protein
MVGASEGGDPAGGWWAWALDAALDGTTMSANWADYPAVGFDTQCIYISTNQFRFNGAFQYSKLRVLNKAELYAGGTASDRTIRWYDLWDLQDPDGVAAFTIQPAVHFRGMGGDPPAYFVDSLWGAGSSLTLWTLQDPLAFWRGGASTLISTAIPCFPYDLPPDAIQEPGGLNRLETNDNRLLNAIYQYAPGGGRRLWTCHHTRYTWPGDSEARSAIQWYEVDISSGAIRQQNRFGAPSRYYFYPAIQTDRGGNAYLVFGRSSADEYAQLRQTGRRSGDDLGDLQSSVSIKDGESAYTQPRWGDYFGIARDGGEPTAIWMFGQYADVGSNWATWIASSSF